MMGVFLCAQKEGAMPEEKEGAKPEEKKEPLQNPEPAKVEGNDIIIDGRKYDPMGALELIKKLRPFEKNFGELQQKVQEFEQAEEQRKKDQLSAIEKAELERNEFEGKYKETLEKLTELELNNEKREVAAEVGLPPAFAERIQGATPEEMKADAKALLDAMPKGVKVNPTKPASAKEITETDKERRRRLGIGR